MQLAFWLPDPMQLEDFLHNLIRLQVAKRKRKSSPQTACPQAAILMTTEENLSNKLLTVVETRAVNRPPSPWKEDSSCDVKEVSVE